MPDNHANFAYSTVLTAPSPALSGTSLVVASGQGALFPAAPFNASVWPTAVAPLSTNAEIIRVTGIAGDTLTIERAQEGTAARTILVGDQIANSVTAKVLTDVEAAVEAVSASHTSLAGVVSVNSAQMTSADGAISAAVAAVSLQHTSLAASVAAVVSAVAANSAQMTSADNAISAAVVALSGQHTSLANSLAGALSAIGANSAQMVSADNAISNRLSTWTLDNLLGVSVPSPTSSQVLKYNSAGGKWVASADATGGGGGSVTSTELSAVSAAAASADATLSARLNSALTVVSNQGSAIVANSAQMTSADNAISAAVVALSAQHTSLAASVAGALSAIGVNSAQMTSADNAISAAVAAVSAQHTSLAASVAGALSAIGVNSAQMVSADNAISNAVSIVSVAQAATSAAVTSVNQVVSVISANVAGISTNVSAISTRLSALSSQVSSNSVQMTSADNAISAAVAAVSAQHTSLAASVAGALSAIAANSAQMTSADNAISNRLSTWTLDNLLNVSAPSPTSSQVLKFNSAAGQWVASADATAGAGGSVLSQEVSAVSAAAASADATLSARIDSVVSAVSAVSAAVNVVSAALVSTNEFVGQRAVLSGNQLVTASALVSVSGFSFSIGINKTYRYEFMIMTSSPISLAVPQYCLSTPAPSYLIGRGDNTMVAEATRVTNLVSQGNRWTGMTTVSAVGSPKAMLLDGCFRASAAGTLVLNMGNAISGAGAGSAITILAGSYGMVWRMV
jgi:hypothetical protein